MWKANFNVYLMNHQIRKLDFGLRFCHKTGRYNESFVMKRMFYVFVIKLCVETGEMSVL